MSGGIGSSASNPHKIKGGKWTVVRFFLLAISHSIGWFTVSSLLGSYALQYGPDVLLKMNIFYYLPSIPLLLFSSLCDEWLDSTFGVPKVILARLLFGLGGCALICALFPFVVTSIRSLLVVIVALGMVSAIAFSSSYQLVARFANKSVISLGLGCVGSGLVVLLLETALGIGATPTRTQLIWLFELTAGLIMVGFAASVSLLVRHWKAILAWQAAEEPEQQDPGQPLLQQEEGRGEEEAQDEEGGHRRRLSLHRRRSTPLLLNYAPLDFMEALSEGKAFNGDAIYLSRVSFPRSRSVAPDSLLHPRALKARGLRRAVSEDRAARSASLPVLKRASVDVYTERRLPPMAPPEGHTPPDGASPRSSKGTPFELMDAVAPAASPPGSFQGDDAAESVASTAQTTSTVALLQVVAQCWPVCGALFFSGTFFVLAFPFFTFVPSSGAFGQDLPKVLFFSRLAADVTGRTSPRVKLLAARSPHLLFAFGLLMTASIPGYLWYIKASRWHNDWAVTAYIVIMWILGGYVNTGAYMLAPSCVDAHHRAAANGVLAITYQSAHCTGLIVATVVAASLFGSFS